MKIVGTVFVGAVAACAAVMLPQPASAGLLIDAGPNSTQQVFNGGNYVAGTEFTSTRDITIYALGYIDAEGDGLVSDHRVGIWSVSTQMLLAEALVTPASPTLPSAQGTAEWYMAPINPIVLPAGTYRVAGLLGTLGDNIALSNDKIGNGVVLSPGYVRTDFPNGGFNYPNLTFSSEAIRVTVADTPIPGPAALALLGLAGLAVRRRR